MKKCVTILLAFVSLSFVPAFAAPITFNFSFSGAATASGTFTTNATSTSGQYLVTGITGTVNGSNITSLYAPGGYPSMFPNDNLLFYPATGSTTFVDTYGISFADAAGASFDFYYGTFFSNAVGYQALTGATGMNGGSLTGVTVTPASTQTVTPEPSSLILLATGLVGAVKVGRRRLVGSGASRS